MASPVDPRHVESFQEDIIMPDLFSVSIEENPYGLLPSSLMMATDEEAEMAAIRSLKEGTQEAERTLSSLNSGAGVNLMQLNSETLRSEPCTSSTTVVKVKEELMYETSTFDNKENKQTLEIKDIMKHPTIKPPSRTAIRQTASNRKPPSQERKRPGRKRLELPSEEEVDKITDPQMKKRLQNRKASRECRARKADYLGEMEDKVRHLESENAELSFKYKEIEKERGKIWKENAQLRLRLDQFEKEFKSMNINMSHLPEIAVC